MKERILGPSGGRRRRLTLAMTGAGLAGVAALFIASAGASLTGSSFEIDGDLNKTPAPSTGTDWCNEDPVTPPCTSLAPSFQQRRDPFVGANDNSFVGGTKQDSVPSTCGGDKGCLGTGSIPGKDDLDRFYLSHETGSNGHTFVYMGFELLPVSSPSASVHEGIEFNKFYCDPTESPKGPSNQCSANGVTPVRSAGDILFVYDLEGGGNPVLTARRWVTSGACEVGSNSPPCWSPAITSGLVAEAENNSDGSVVDPINPNAPRTIQQFRFGEASVDLTASGLLTGCEGFASAYIVSRSSGNSDTAQMKDLISPLRANINNCGTLVIDKVTVPSGESQLFDFTASGGNIPAADQAFQLADATTPKTITGLNPTSSGSPVYAVNETVPTGWTLTSKSCAITAGGTGSTGTATSTGVTGIAIGAGQTVTCTFTDTKLVASSASAQRWLPNDRIVLTTNAAAGLDGTLTATLYHGSFGGTAANCTAGTATAVTGQSYTFDTSPGGVNDPSGSVYQTTNTSFFVGTNPGGTPGGASAPPAAAGDYFWLIHYVDNNTFDPPDRCETSNVSITD